MKIIKEKDFYTVKSKHHENHFLALWQLIAFLVKIDTEAQKN